MIAHTGGRLADRLAAARRRHFVGRREEAELFRAALLAREPAFCVLHVHGLGGVGKTSLLGEFARLAEDAGVRTVRVDGRDLEPTPRGFLAALGEALGVDDATLPLDHLARQPRTALFVDTLEALAPLDAWLREAFLPQLPDGCLVVTAGRHPPHPAWRSDPGWRDLVRDVPLRNLRPEESREYLSARGVSDGHHAGVLAFTRGHPLALALAADAAAHGGPAASFRPDDRPDVVRVLLERFLDQVPSPRHREALEVCAHSRVTTEALLASAMGEDDAPLLFRWLRGLSFIEEGREGLLPHELAREVLNADLRWRNPAAYRDVHQRVRRFVIGRMQAARGREQQRAAADLMYLHRDSAVMARLRIAEWESLGFGYAEEAAASDFPTITELVRRHEGEESARIADHWLRRQPGAFTAFRGAAGELLGFAAFLALHEATTEDLEMDPAAAAALDFVRRQGGTRPGEQLLYHRYWVGCDTYQTVSPMLNLLATTCTARWLSTPHLAYTFIAFADPSLWQETFTYMRFRRAPEADFEVGGRTYGVFVHDWRAEPATAWLDRMGEREVAMALTVDELETPPAPPGVLSRSEFDAAVRQALRDFTRPAALATSPLLHSRAAAARAEGAPTAATLQALLREAAETLRGNPRDEKLYRAIQRTYLDPAASQELAAELLDLPFSTYRYHLNRGIAHVTEWLWEQERHAGEP